MFDLSGAVKLRLIRSIAFKPLFIAVASVGLCCASAHAQSQTFLDGGNRLVQTQNPDGGWHFGVTGPTATNTLTPVGMGLAKAYEITGNSGQLTALQNAAAFFLTRDNNFAPDDGLFAAELDKIFGGTTYRSFVKTNYYDKLQAGTYQPGGTGPGLNVAGLVTRIQTTAGNNQTAWGVGLGLAGAVAVGENTSDWVASTEGMVNLLTAGQDYDVLGLGGTLYGLGRANATFDPTAGSFQSASSIMDLANTLAGFQIPSTGGFTYNALTLIPNSDETVQETAYALLALNSIDYTTFNDTIVSGGAYLRSAQLNTGGWEDFTGALENNSTTGEAMWGLQISLPEPGSMALLAFGGLLSLRRKRSI